MGIQINGTNDTISAADGSFTIIGADFTIGAGSTSAPSLAPSGDSNTGVFFPSADTIAFAEGGAEAARIDSSGRFLLGTSSSRAVSSQSGTEAPLQIETTSYLGFSIANNTNDGGAAEISLGKSRGTAAGGTTVVQSGDALGVISFNGADGTDLQTEAARISAEVDGTPGSNDMPGRLVFSTTADGASSPTARMRILSNGVTKISSNGNYIATNPYHELYQSNDANSIILFTHTSTSSPYGLYLQFSGSSPDNNANWFFYAQDTSATRFVVYSDGDVQNHDNSYGAVSDEKLKQDIVDAGSQWDDLKNLRVRKFKFKSDVEAYGDEAKTLIGVVAQEVETVSPGLVKNNPDKDAENNDLGTVTKSVNYSVLYMKAVKALQEAMVRIETLETANASQAATIAALDARLTALEAQ